MTPRQSLDRKHLVWPAVGGVILLMLLWLTPAGRGRDFTVGTWLWDAGDWIALCEGWLILTVVLLMCWWQGKTRVRLSEVRSGHWLWLAAGLVFLLFYVLGMHVREMLFALGMLPPLLLCGVCWVCGARTGMGFAWPLLMLYAFAPVCGNWVRSWSFDFERMLCEWLNHDFSRRPLPAYEWGLYPYFPRPGTSLFLVLALCWLTRWSWWKMALIAVAGTGLAAAHVYFFGRGGIC